MKRNIIIDGENIKIYPASKDEKNLIKRLFNRNISFMGRNKDLEYIPLTRAYNKIGGKKW